MESFNNQDLLQIENLLNGTNTDAINSGAIERLNRMQAQVSARLIDLNKVSLAKLHIAERKLDGYKQKETEAIKRGEFKESGLDSLDVARAILYCIRTYNIRYTPKSKLIAILYQAYCTWLANQNERLCMEHPCASEWGPQFWRAYSKIDLREDDIQLRQAFNEIASQNPGRAKFISNVTAKYYNFKEEDMRNAFIQSKPYRMALPERNNGKWGKEITDAEIYEWKRGASAQQN